MSEQIEKTLVPQLRFPEFQDVGEWEGKKLGEVAPLQRGFDLPSNKIKPGSVPVVYSNGVRNFHSIGMAEGPGLVTGRSGTIGKIHFIEDGDYWPHNTSLWVTSFKGNSPKFIYFLYLSIGISRFASGSGVPTLNRNDVHAFNAYIPSSPEEQQKIANCLSSIDELITAHSQKHETLKTHKKGLMQQLFPAEGETVPKLRFPEFLDVGEWEEHPLGGICSSISSGKDKSDTNGTYDLYGSTGIIGKTSSDTFTGDFILAARVGANAGLLTRASGKFGVTDNTLVIFLKKSEKIDFIYYSLDRLGLNKMVFGSGQPLITGRQLKALSIYMPVPEEQQKIADCLSSIDDLITAQAQKIESLKTHKKGLMQQLFPAADELNG